MALVTVGILTVLTAGIALAQGHVANDGQTLEKQSPEVQQLYTSVWGDNAAMRWVTDHNAAIGQVAPQAQHPRYDDVFHVAYMRSMDMELAGRITADVIARGTIDQFMAGTDMGVLYGYVAPAPQPRAASSSSTSSGPSTPTSSSTSSVSGWGPIVRNYEVGQKVSLTLPSSSHADVDGYNLLPVGEGTLSALGFDEFDSSKRQVTGTTTTPGTFVGTYSAREGIVDIGEPFILMLTINVREADLQPVFANRSIESIRVVEDGGPITAVPLPEAVSGNAPTYKISGEPKGIMFLAEGRVLSGTPMETGTFLVTYTATDQDGDTASLTFTITVEKNTVPNTPSIGNMIFTEGEMVARTLRMASGGNGKLTYTLTSLPAELGGLEFVGQTRYLHGEVDALGEGVTSQTFTVTYLVTEAGGADPDLTPTTFTITVNAAE